MSHSLDWLRTSNEVHQWFTEQHHRLTLGFDTEFERIRTYYPKLALLQCSNGPRTAVIDPLKDFNGPAFGESLSAFPGELVMHSASEDLEALKPLLPAPLPRLFDTQIAAAFAGFGPGLGYANLVQQVFGEVLDKSETRSDWMQRPLSEAQLKYAHADVTHLDTLHERLRARLLERGMLEWCLADCKALAHKHFDGNRDRQPHWSFRSAAHLSMPQQARLARLLQWREQTAMRIDRPKNWVFDNEIAFALASKTPTQIPDLQRQLQAARSFPKAALAELFELLQSDAVPADFKPAPNPVSGAEKSRMGRIREVVEAQATALDLPSTLLLPKRGMEALAREATWPDEFAGWRQQLLQDRVQAVI